MKRNCQNKLVKANELLMIALLLMAGQYLLGVFRRANAAACITGPDWLLLLGGTKCDSPALKVYGTIASAATERNGIFFG